MRGARLLTISHSYVVGLNRRLADEMASAGDWEVVAAAPKTYAGDLGRIVLERGAGERCSIVPVGVRRSRWPHVMSYGPELRRLLDDDWDVVHCWEEPYVLAAAQVARWARPSVRLVFATFQNIPKRYPPPLRWFERTAMRRADGWIAFGHTAEGALGSRPGYAERPHRVIPPGVDPSLFKPDDEARLRTRAALGWAGDDAPVIGFLGRFVPEKGPRVLTAALDGVRRPWRALFVGGGPLESELRAWARRHGDRVRIATDVTHDDVPAHLNAMDLLCAPSQTTPRWREQFGRMLVEAFACGVPVVASSSGEIPHVVGDAGVLLPEADAAAWSSTIASLLEDEGRRSRLAHRGRARAERFAWPRVAAEHLAFFEELRVSHMAGRRA
ncbi:MAG: glycosyltransferase family 4 protein [Vicinamibacterales bacterium]